MDNAYLTNPEDKYETPWYLLRGGIIESFQYDTFESFNEKLWQLLIAMTSCSKKEDKEKTRLTETIDNLILMVKGCHYFLHHKKRLDFKEDWIDIKWLRNPYRCLEKYRSDDDSKLNHHLAHFKESFSNLTREEAQDFTLAFKNFFAEMDLSSWLNLLNDWKACLEGNESLFDWRVDFAPLKTYERLLTLHEACIIGYHWAEMDYPPPNRHLIEDYLSSEYVNGYHSASPFEMIGDIFYEKNYSDIRQSILELYAICSCKRKGIDLKAIDLRSALRWLLETGWLLLQTDYFPEDWLDPNSVNFLRCPIPEKQAKYWKPKSLSGKEQKKLRKTLSKLYYGIDVRQEIYAVESRIIRYLDPNTSDSLSEDNLATQNRLLKILDILTLIVLDLRKRRTKPEGVCYPPIVDEEHVKVEEKMENKPEIL